MTIQFFAPRSSAGRQVQLPTAYRKSVKWQAQIGDIFPDFSVKTTMGNIDFWDWAEGHWTHLFSHPAAFTPVCTTEILAFAGLQNEFADAGVRLMSLTGSPVEDQRRWHEDIKRVFGVEVGFPAAEDPSRQLSECFGMLHPKESTHAQIRKSFVIGPDLRIRMISEYPLYIGRNSEEVLRVIRALQVREKTGAATPSDWFEGDCLIVPDGADARLIGEYVGKTPVAVTPYLRLACGSCQG